MNIIYFRSDSFLIKPKPFILHMNAPYTLDGIKVGSDLSKVSLRIGFTAETTNQIQLLLKN